MHTDGVDEENLLAARGRRRSKQRAATRTLIVEAAQAIIDRDGVEATTLDAIVAALGLTKPGLYYHFASKEALLVQAAVRDWKAVAAEVDAATSAAASAEEALEALVRSYVAHYRERLHRFELVTQCAHVSRLAAEHARSLLDQIRPLNDLFYGATERKLIEAQIAGRADPALNPRRLAFTAHLGAMGLLSMKLMVEAVGDPLRHSDEALIGELCRTLAASVSGRAPTRFS